MGREDEEGKERSTLTNKGLEAEVPAAFALTFLARGLGADARRAPRTAGAELLLFVTPSSPSLRNGFAPLPV